MTRFLESQRSQALGDKQLAKMYLPYKLQEKIIEFFIKMAALLLQKQSIFPFTVLNDVFLLCRAQVKEQL